ncbi:hypothetical protein GCM10023339_40950 [Alloalcanivorax gelatiniphagus]
MPAQQQAVSRKRKWFPAAVHGRYVLDQGEVRWRPAAEIHAKQPGSTSALCGSRSTHWQVFWDMPFPPATNPAWCPRCVQRKVRAGTAR